MSRRTRRKLGRICRGDPVRQFADRKRPCWWTTSARRPRRARPPETSAADVGSSRAEIAIREYAQTATAASRNGASRSARKKATCRGSTTLNSAKICKRGRLGSRRAAKRASRPGRTRSCRRRRCLARRRDPRKRDCAFRGRSSDRRRNPRRTLRRSKGDATAPAAIGSCARWSPRRPRTGAIIWSCQLRK